MIPEHFWLTAAQFAKLQPLLSTDARGKPGVDDCQVISGIAHMLKSALGRCARRHLWTTQNALQLVRALGRERGLDLDFPCFGASQRPAIAASDRHHGRESPSLRVWQKRGEQNQAIGRSRSERTTKMHALTDSLCHAIAFLLTGGKVADCTVADASQDTVADASQEQLSWARLVNGDKGYDSDAVHLMIERGGALPNIPPKANRRWKNCFLPYLCRDRNTIERSFGRLNDLRRIATRYDRSATNFLATVCIADTVSY